MPRVIVGLGNTLGFLGGRARHDLGTSLIEACVRARGGEWRLHPLLLAWVAQVGPDHVFVTPLLPYNLSGWAAARCLRRFGGSLVVVHDDLDLAPGRIRTRQGGSHGGNNGLRSVVAALQGGGTTFSRVAVGVGRPPASAGRGLSVVSAYVLSAPTPEEAALIREAWVGVNLLFAAEAPEAPPGAL